MKRKFINFILIHIFNCRSNKKNFGLQVIDFFDNMILGMVEPVIGDRGVSPVKQLENVFDLFIEMFKALDYTCGCPIGNLSQKMGDLSPAFSDRLTESVKLIVEMYKNILDEAKDQDLINQQINTKETADFIVSSWHGALIRMKIVKGVEPLKLHKRFILNTLQYPTTR
jgi:TetR/AcrR family transcriptional regulator, transcriptional repressor for nem operon